MPGSRIVESANGGKVRFSEEDHKYVYVQGGHAVVLRPVTSVIGSFFPKFDATRIAASVAKRRGVPASEVLAEWDSAAEYGTRVHENMEDVLLGRPARNVPKSDKEQVVFGLARAFAQRLLPKICRVEPEKIVCDSEYRIAGTIDLFARSTKDPNLCYMFDWKTNKRIRTRSDYGKTGFPPIEDMDDCEYSHYALQLNTYEWILRHAGYVAPGVRILKHIVHFTKEIGIKVMRIPDMQNRAQSILNAFRENENLDDLG